MPTVVEYGSTDQNITTRDASYSNAREGPGAAVLAVAGTSVGQRLFSDLYYVYQFDIRFNGSANAGETISGVSLFLNVTSANGTTPLEVRRYDGWSSGTGAFVAGSALSGYTLLGSLSINSTGSKQVTLSNTEITSNFGVVLSSSRQRTNTAPSGDEYLSVSNVATSGTTNDPRIEYSYTPPNTAPTITSSSTANVPENSTLSHSLTATDPEGDSLAWTIVGGVDSSHFEISGTTLQWASNGTKDHESPADTGANNTYQVTVRATDTGGLYAEQTITVTVTNVSDNHYDLAASAGSFALSGQTAALQLGRKVTASEGSFTLAGQVAALAATRTLGAETGAFSLAGDAESLTAGRSLSAGAGSFALTGAVVGLDYGTQNRIMSAAAGSFTLSGDTATLARSRTMTASAGAFTLGGGGTVLARGLAISAGAGAFALSDTATGLSVGRGVVAEAGAFELTGEPVTFGRNGYTLNADAGSYIITGGAVTFRFQGWLPIAASPATWTPIAAATTTWTAQ